jgi:hypothetical protein
VVPPQKEVKKAGRWKLRIDKKRKAKQLDEPVSQNATVSHIDLARR